MDEDDKEKKRRQARERQERFRARQSGESLAKIRASDAEYQRRRVASLNPEQLQTHRENHAASEQRRVATMDSQQLQAHRENHAASEQRRVATMNPQQLQAHRANNAESQRMTRDRVREATRNEAIYFSEDQATPHDCGSLDVLCNFCASRNFAAERPADKMFTSCCRKGKIKLPQPIDVNGNIVQYPDFLKSLMSDAANPQHKHFRDNIRSYNSAVSFASMGAKVVDLPGRGPYVFKIHGTTYHRTSHLQPVNDEAPQYAQLYVLDSSQATDHRQNHPANANCRADILDQIDRFFRENNRLAQSYQLIRDIEAQEAERAAAAGEQIPIVSMAFKRDRQSDQRRYNEPTSNEVAMIFVNEDGEPPFHRDIHVYPKNPANPDQQFINLNILSPNMDPMTYAILFPFGEPGWQPNWKCSSFAGSQKNKVRKNISMLQFKAALTAIRGDFNPIMNAGKLTQQWLVDSYLQVEANNLNYIRQNQKRLRAEQYQGLADHVANAAQTEHIAAGVSVILPSSFEGSPRNMRERCCDAMSIFAKKGAPDLFITFTANPSWKEITANLRPGEAASDRPDLVARVFKIKLDALLNDITGNGIFGRSVAFVYTIEFQKRGLPHAHILITLRAQDKFTTTERIDQYICAEIPAEATSSNAHPTLREIVLKCMIHGPCGIAHPNSPCMKDGKCSKQYPKEFNANTQLNVNGYPLYRRRHTNERVTVRGVLVDNRNVVPYNPFLSYKYNAHINVECATSLRFVKYIYKYIFKGYDCANVTISSTGESELRYNEISNFLDCRYVSAPEAIWRLRESKMHDRSHAVMRLPVHLPNQQRVVFEEGHEEEALLAAQTGKTKLESWFALNQNSVAARVHLYTDMPLHYVFERNQWKERQRGSEKIIARMYTVSVKDQERFYLRLLLLHTPGATSFEFLRTVDGIVHESFKSAAMARGLLESDDEWNRCLTDAGTHMMPKQLREMFAYICIFCQPARPIKLWQDHSDNLLLDYLRLHNDEEAENLALHDLNFILMQHGMSCSSIGLPVPTGDAPAEDQMFDQQQEGEIATVQIEMLNDAQMAAFVKIIIAVDNNQAETKLFYLDGPGGSGKTFLYNTLMSYFRGEGCVVLPFATTGIAATLMKGGRTVHSGFKLPVPLLDNSVSSMRLTSPEAAVLREAVLIVIDEVTMLPKNGLRCIEKLLREIMGTDEPFGGKVLVLGGDFRQTLPVVQRGTRTDIVECCIKSSPLWSEFEILSLTTNMRSEGQNEHNEWLLKVGSGSLPPPSDNLEDTIEIPRNMVTNADLIPQIFANIQAMTTEELAKRVIVAPTNAQTLEMNRKIIDLIPGEPAIYYSADSMITEDANDTLNYPVEFLNEQTPSGTPPHVLLLKKGVIIMLLRNLNPKKGMCNGTRLAVEELGRNFIKAKIISQCNNGATVLIPRIDIIPTESNLPFTLRRRQFPIIPAYAMTINKSQGQSFDHVGIHLETAVFSHGQMYVALSRSRNSANVKVFIEPNPQQGPLLNDDRQFTRNVVFTEIL